MPINSITPVIDHERRNTTWYKPDIYTGQIGHTGRYVPNVNDLAYDYETGYWRCIHVDYNTGFSTLVPWNFGALSGGISNTDVIIGGGPGIGSEHYRIYVNTKVVPYEFSIDVRLRLYGSEASYIKIFREGDVTGDAISAEFNSAGVLVSENIQLENVIIPNTTVNAIKTPKQGHLTEKLENGEVVSVAVYSNSGAVLSIFKLVVVNTNFVRTIDTGRKLITDVSLITPYLNSSDRSLIEFPANMTLGSAGLYAKITYNDGSTERRAVANSEVKNAKVQLHGTQNYVVSQVGQTVPLVLSYRLAKDEFSNHVNEVNGERFINKRYRLVTKESDGMYDVKLFVVPYWNRNNSQWELQYWLANLNRDFLYNVTRHIEYVSNKPVFDGTNNSWGKAQQLTVALNLDKVNSSYNYYRHVTDFTITLYHAGSNPASHAYYTLQYDANSTLDAVTVAQVKRKSSNRYELDISGGRKLANDWLQEVYFATDPLRYPYMEAEAPTPTHVKIMIGENFNIELPISEAIKRFEATINEYLVHGWLVRLEFLFVNNSKRMLLGTTGLIVKMVE